LLYALRDVTATVESIPLISSSIMSKKIASGLDGLVLDVKTGIGAFMQNYEQSKLLAETLIRIGNDYGKSVMAFITDMNEPMGYAVGNWLEVKECVECLQGRNDDLVADTLEVSLTLSGAMLMMAKKVTTIDEGIELSNEQLKNGKALDKFLEIVKAQGGEKRVLKTFSKYPKSQFSERVAASQSGFISDINALEIGLAAIGLGAGRLRKEDNIEPKAGIVFHHKVGDEITKGDSLIEIFTDKKHVMDEAKKRIEQAITYAATPVLKKKKVLEQI
jgi:pyrimidine-nucleoside phosphorylase